jgi:hypothetical protein
MYKKRVEDRHMRFDKLIEKCFSKILHIAKTGALCMFYEVPEFVLGFPMYNLNECIEYIHQKMTDNGFFVKYFFPNILYISWNEKELEQESSKKNELANRMLLAEGKVSASRKKKASKKIVLTL